MGEIAADHPPEKAKYLQGFASETEVGKAALLEMAGYTPVRVGYEMVRPNLDDIPDFPLPDGIEVRPVHPDHYRRIWEADTSLTLESGLLVWVVAVGAFACGMRGISRRGVVAMTLLLGAYVLVRFAYLSTGAPGLDERTAGVWVTMMTPDELTRRFGADPTWFYVYNVVASMLSVLFADPEGGVFLTARTWLDGEMPARLYLATVPTAAPSAAASTVDAPTAGRSAQRRPRPSPTWASGGGTGVGLPRNPRDERPCAGRAVGSPRLRP
jgi:hypothetical protein